jgi:hypothetical protein
MLRQKDCIKILNYYHIPIPQSKQAIRSKAEMLLSTKLCKCITKGKMRRLKGKKNVTCRKAKNVLDINSISGLTH